MNKYRESKEDIKDRMIRTALDFWNIKNIENLDPIVRLLLEALAAQLHLLSEEIADIEIRTMQRLSEVLLPESISLAKPSHGIVHIDVQMEEMTTSPLEGFYATTPFPGRKDNLRYSFYPICKTPLRKGSVKKVIIGGEVYGPLPGMNKKLLLRSDLTPENHNKIFVGLDFSDETINLNNLSFYIDFPNIDRRNDYLHLLTYCKWSFNGNPLKVKGGIHSLDEITSDELVHFFQSQEYNSHVVEDVLNYYKLNYVTIDEDMPISSNLRTFLPLGILQDKSVDVDRYTEVCNENLLWIELEFPPHFSPSILSDTQIGINTVPVINKELHVITTDVRKSFGIIPISVSEKESFMGIVDVKDEDENVYSAAGGYYKSGAEHAYSIRQGGCETFDERDAKDYLLRLQNLLEDEMGVFSVSDFGINAENPYLISQLIQRIKKESRRHIHSNTEKTNYLFVDPPQEMRLLTIRYWTTLGEWANGMRIGQTLHPSEASYGDMLRATLITPSAGGMAAPSIRERTARFKHILGSRNRIVTNNDIRNFCLAELSENISDVRIEKGIMAGKHPGEGLIRTIDVHLIPLARMDDTEKMQQIRENMYNRLVEHSPMTFNYRIFID